jgi:hypothetical protein
MVLYLALDVQPSHDSAQYVGTNSAVLSLCGGTNLLRFCEGAIDQQSRSFRILHNRDNINQYQLISTFDLRSTMIFCTISLAGNLRG